jgi:hypothetical protein
MDSTPSGPQANPDQGSSPEVKAPMDPTPSRPQVNTDQGRTDVKALEEALSKLVGEGTASAFERRAQMAGSDAVWADEPSLRATPRIADLKDRPFLGDTPSPRSRFSRALTRFLVVAFIGVGCTLAWQSYGETAKQKLATSAPQLGWVLSLAGLKPWPAELIAERSSGPLFRNPSRIYRKPYRLHKLLRTLAPHPRPPPALPRYSSSSRRWRAISRP